MNTLNRCTSLSSRVQLGDDIVFEIFTWLPAKSLMRLRCVSKALNTLIRDDLNFVKSHIARSYARPSATHLLFELGNEHPPYPRSYEKLQGFSLQLAPHHFSDARPSEITICLNQCNSLVCLKNYLSRVYLYNVTTREIKALPSSLINFNRYVSKLFLGFDKVTEKYKLLHLLDSKIEILTLGTNSRREIKLIPEISSLDYHSRYCIFLNGLLYWRSKKVVNNCMEYFDFREEKFGILSSSEDKYRDIIKSPALWKRRIRYSSFPQRYEKRHLIPDEANKVLMKYGFDDPNSEKVGTVQHKAERFHQNILATMSYISAPATLVFSSHLVLHHASSFVENITPLSFIDV